MTRKVWVGFLAWVLLGASAGAEDFSDAWARAQGLPARFAGKAVMLDLRPHWLGPDRFWFRAEKQGGRGDYWLVVCEPARTEPLFAHAALADALGRATGARLDPERLAVRPVALDGARLRFLHEGRAWTWDRASATLSADSRREGEREGLRPLRFAAVSGDGGDRVELVFVNRSASPVRLWWVTREGPRTEYGRIEPGQSRRQGTFAGHVWLLTPVDSETELAFYRTPDFADQVVFTGQEPRPEKAADRPRREGVPSPDGRWIAFVREANLFVRPAAGGDTVALSSDAKAGDAYAEETIRWSPDAARLVAHRVQAGGDRLLKLVESSPRDQLQPRVLQIPYLKPGDAIPQPRAVLFDLVSRRATGLDDRLTPTPWSLSTAQWAPDGRSFTMLYNQRGHQVVRLVRVDGWTGAVVTLAEESSQTFVDYPNKIWFRLLEESSELLWMSQRSGWNHLYRLDAATGRMKNAITRGAWVVRGVEHVDLAGRRLILRVLGAIPGQDPYHVHFASVGFDGEGFQLLTEADGTHKVTWSPDRRYFVATHSRVDAPPVHELRRTRDGARLLELGRADVTALLAAGYVMPERFVAKGRDGKTDIWGVVWRPTGYDSQRRYPLIESIYAGPHDHHVPKGFQSYFGQQAIAELGAVVVQIDGMGTNWRSKAFHDVAWKNLADAGFPDRVLWIRALGARDPSLDLSRVGIYGGSAGGQNAMRALLDHADLYKVAVACSGNHDNRMDKIWWNELWMGWPVDEAYARSSNREHAGRLRGDLLLIVGELDTNVDPSSTLQVADALIRADRPFELLMIPGAGHGAAGTPFGARRQAQFLFDRLVRR